MSEKPIHATLKKIAEQGVPPADVSLWPRVRRQLETSTRSSQEGETRMERRTDRRRLIPLGATLLIIALLVTFLAATPQGRAWAQEVLRYFNRAGSDTIALTPVTADGTIWGLSLAESEDLAGVDVLAPASVPPGYRLDDVIYNRATGEVTQLYKFSPGQAGEFFVLTQSPALPDDKIGTEAVVETLDFGGTPVEYVSGQWFAAAGSVTEQWIQDQPVHTFRWQSGSSTLTLQFWVGDTFSPAYLTRDDMFAMVEVVMGTRATFPDRPNLNYLVSIEQAEAAAGFNIPAPTVLPEGFTFSYAAYEPGQRVVLIYEPQDGQSDGVRMVIIETFSPPDLSGYPPEALEAVLIGDIFGTYIHGGITDGVYDPDQTGELYWEQEGLQIGIHVWGSGSQPLMERDELLRIAESMH